MSTVRSRKTANPSLLRKLTNVPLKGFIIIVPFVLTLYLLNMALGIVRGVLQPVIELLRWTGIMQAIHFGPLGQWFVRMGLYRDVSGFITELIAVLVLLATIVALGSVGSFRFGQVMVAYVDAAVAVIPGVGPVYKSFRRMGDVVLESGLENFKEVKLIEFPQDGMFSLAFETNHAPASVESAVGTDDMITLFVPLAPNPVMGGFLIHISRDRVFDIDMTVEEAARSLITSGIAGGDGPESQRSLDPFRRLKDRNGAENVIPIVPTVVSGAELRDGENGQNRR